MADSFSLNIVTPSGTVYADSEVFSLVARGEEGEFAVLPDHASFLTPLRISELRVWKMGRRRQEEERAWFVAGGLLEVAGGEVVILSSAVEAALDIDVERAEQARSRARSRLASEGEEVDVPRARQALRRAEVRLRVASAVIGSDK